MAMGSSIDPGSVGDLLEALGAGTFGYLQPDLEKLFKSTLMAGATPTKTSDWQAQLKQMFPAATKTQLDKTAKALTELSKVKPPAKGGKARALSSVLKALGITHQEPGPKWLRDAEQAMRAQSEGARVHDVKATSKLRSNVASSLRRSKTLKEYPTAVKLLLGLLPGERTEKIIQGGRIQGTQARLEAARKAGMQKVLGPRNKPTTVGVPAPGGVQGPTPPPGGRKGVPGTGSAGAMPFQALLRAMMAGKGGKMPNQASNMGVGAGAGAAAALPLLLGMLAPGAGTAMPIVPGMKGGPWKGGQGPQSLEQMLPVSAAGYQRAGASAATQRRAMGGMLGKTGAGAIGGGAVGGGKTPFSLAGLLKSPWAAGGAGALIGLLLASLFRETITGPQEFETQGEAALAGMPPPELTALQGMVPQQAMQGNALFGSLMQQMGGGRSPVGGEMAL